MKVVVRRIVALGVLPVSLALALLAGCSPFGPTPPAQVASAKDLELSNGTTLAVTLVVNGNVIRTFPRGVRGAVAPRDLPPLPWAVEARSPSGRVLVSMTVRPGDVRETTAPGGGREYRGAGARVDLSCGRLDLWSGPPLLGPAPGPGRPGDCEP